MRTKPADYGFWYVTTLFAILGCSDNGSAASHHSAVDTISAEDAGSEDSGAGTRSDITVSGPVTGGKGKAFSTATLDLDANGYQEAEYFFEGTTQGYALSGDMTIDGKWNLTDQDQAAFKTRLLVRRPKDAGKFNGTVVVEWLNVSGGVDAEPGFMYNQDMLVREGFVWVGVSAQHQGVEGGGFSLTALTGTINVPPLKQYDPERYGTLSQPGDAYSYDIFSIAGAVIRHPRQVNVLGGLKPKHLIAYGESQSAGYMVSYVNGVHPLAKAYDAFFIHSRGAGGADFQTSLAAGSLPSFGGAQPTHIRDDIDEEVFQFQTETDVTGALGFLPARQPDTDKFRTWEVAGTSHADEYLVDLNSNNPLGQVKCPNANSGPQYRIIRAALHSLNVWLNGGNEPPRGDLLQTDANGKSVRDEHGNALGGVRSPDVDVPIKTLSGDAAPGSDVICFIFGTTTPFTSDELMSLYATHDDYVQKVSQSAEAAQKAGFVLEPEAMGFIADAQNAPVPQ